MEDSDRCDELQDFIDTLFDLRERLNRLLDRRIQY